jgi:hypothetical protein
LKGDSAFAPAHIALNSLLYDFEPHDLTASALPAASESNMAAHKAQINEARKLRQQIIHFPAWAVSVPNRASACYGLCRQASKHARSSNGVEREHYLAYYCKQAAALYAGLSPVGLASQSTAYEIRRELAHACLCADSTDRRGSPEESVRALRERAVGLLMSIRGKGLTRESRPYGPTLMPLQPRG